MGFFRAIWAILNAIGSGIIMLCLGFGLIIAAVALFEKVGWLGVLGSITVGGLFLILLAIREQLARIIVLLESRPLP